MSSATPTRRDTRHHPAHVVVKDHRWAILAVIGIAQLAVVLDATIVNIALPAAQRDLGFADDQRQWIVTAYSLAFGSLLLLGGRLGDLFGRKNTFIVGLVGFAGTSVVGGLAENFGQLVAARAGQGVFGALLAPSALALLTTTFTDPKERAKAFGVFGAIAGSGAATGVLLGGVLTEYTTWRWCLYVNVVFAVLGVVGALVFMPRPVRGHRPRLDLLGTATITVGLVGIVYGFSNAERHGWSDVTTIVSLVAGVVLVALFVLVESRVSHPLLPLRIVRDRDRGGALIAIGLVGVAMFGIFLFLTYYLNQTLRFSSLETGLSFLPMPFSIMTAATQITPRLLPRVGPKVLLRTGGIVAAAGILLFLRTAADSTWAGTVLPALVVTGLGMGLIVSSAMNTATAGVAREDAGAASASVNTFQQIGGSIGTALLSTVFASAVEHHGGNPADAVLHGYHVAFTGGAIAVFLVAVVSGSLVNRHAVRQERLAGITSIPAPSAAH
ncbi:MFS transporter [Kineococcus rhizosphaerae]|uniref:EmrB/QacA subfamily drug resistance transporter n=1 Tax=Kineococcus rhizosphaerae TaxID=559628 RepID=A0A2T0R6A2_9ACTN|nr:MFS transporter [Kineococcus rhizosphaerae]PRY16672.1 EmrB/QacA subfamily drug resistance transporter [Kineococcus rhizosphaerae]